MGDIETHFKRPTLKREARMLSHFKLMHESLDSLDYTMHDSVSSINSSSTHTTLSDDSAFPTSTSSSAQEAWEQEVKKVTSARRKKRNNNNNNNKSDDLDWDKSTTLKILELVTKYPSYTEDDESVSEAASISASSAHILTPWEDQVKAINRLPRNKKMIAPTIKDRIKMFSSN
jgi:dGTP triphosphohydrolase